MHAGRFLSLVRNYTDLRPEELNAARELAAGYPYCQIIHLLVARGVRDQKGKDEQPTLHRAAVYATDRTVLKHVITRAIQPRVEVNLKEETVVAEVPAAPPAPVAAKPALKPEPKKVEAKKAETKKEEPAKAAIVPTPAAKLSTPPVTLEGDALRDDLKSELTKLHNLMDAFDASYEKIKKGTPTVPPTPAAELKPSKKTAAPKAPAAEDMPEAPLIEEIKSSKRKPKLVSPKVAEQGEIIDNFIKVAPTLPRTKPGEPGADLSLESANYSDQIVSETLVEILLKQGKKAKAIEMLKKLIWKFPQKKAYFAAQIEALKG